jgi:uncharacterized protein
VGERAGVHLYQGTSEQFIADAVQARLADQLSERFFNEFRYRPARSEIESWRHSLGAMANVLQLADLRDQGILVELKLPLTSKRLDVLITGSNPSTGDAAVIIELKQWTHVGRSNISDCVTVEYGGGHLKDVLHPSRQVAQYQRYLMDTHPAFSDGAIELNACSFLHYAQHDPTSPLYHADFDALLALNPLFTGNDVTKLTYFLEEHVVGPDDGSILEKIAATAFKPHKRLLDHVARVIQNDPVFTLLDEQLVAFNAIMDSVKAAGQNQQSVVFLVSGGPGTGKSVIAVNLVAQLAALGLSTLHLTGSKAFTENLRKTVGPRAAALFKYFRDTATVATDEKLDVAILDEAHRIRTISTNRFTPAKARNGKAQIDDILDSARTSVFFIDDLQVVRPGEVGSTDLIREAAAKRSIEVREFELEAQFRSNGSDSFIQWVDNTLELARTPQVLWPMDDEFDFRIVPSVHELERLIRLRASEGATARLVAGFCWPWSDPDENGELVEDVRVGDWSMPWNAKADARRLAPGIPKSDFWASGKEGINQVGCVYTAQGFEFDYVGVIFGPDLVYRPVDGGWVGQPKESFDRVVSRGVTTTAFTDFVKSTYRVLLTRGLRGCYTSFVDPATRDFAISRTERANSDTQRSFASSEPR